MKGTGMAARWSADILASTNALIATASRRKNLGPFPASAFGLTASGKQDFRGLVLTESIQYLSVKDADFAHAGGSSISERARVTTAHFRDIHRWHLV